MYAWQFSKMQHIARQNGYARFVTMQNHYNVVYREEEREMNPLCIDQQVGLIPWSPLARGFVTGNRKKQGWGESKRAKTDDFAHNMYYQDSDFAVVERVTEIATRRGLPNAQIALAWLLHQPGVTAPIIGATKMPHLEDAVAAISVKLSQDELDSLAEPYQPHPVLGNLS
jgi:aryl-alcohol dehydrogenase (NADP+)